jgi:hypothetical protein
MAERDVILDAYALNPGFRTNSIRLPARAAVISIPTRK